MTYEIIRLTDRPEWKEQAASWFHEKWGIPKEEYLNSMEECLEEKSPVPQWYLAVEDGRIIELGSHRELLALKGHYYQLYTGQHALD